MRRIHIFRRVEVYIISTNETPNLGARSHVKVSAVGRLLRNFNHLNFIIILDHTLYPPSRTISIFHHSKSVQSQIGLPFPKSNSDTEVMPRGDGFRFEVRTSKSSMQEKQIFQQMIFSRSFCGFDQLTIMPTLANTIAIFHRTLRKLDGGLVTQP